MIIDTPAGIRLFALLSLRGRLAVTIRTGMPWRVPASRGIAAHFPDQPFPRSLRRQLAWLEDRIEAEYGPIGDRYTPADWQRRRTAPEVRP